MKPLGLIGTTGLVLLLGTTAPVWAQQGKPTEAPDNGDKQDKGKGHSKEATQQKGQEHSAAPQAKQQQASQQQPAKQQQAQHSQEQPQLKQQQADQEQAQRQHATQQANEQRAQQRQARQQANEQRAQQQQQAQQQLATQQANQQRAQQQLATQRAQQQLATQQANEQRAQQQQLAQQQLATQQANQQRANQQQVRVSQARQQQLITAQQNNVVQYRQLLDQQQPLATQYGVRLQQQNRTASYQFQQEYVAHIRQQQLGLQSSSYDYDNDPYFYTAPSYRYSRGGSYYETNEYGANVLRQSINYGYAQGYGAGQADRQDHWVFDYRNAYGYQDANYGYSGYYVNQADYNYYFRQGFRRGYQDGYYRRTRYGQYSNGSRSILGTILPEILSLQSMR